MKKSIFLILLFLGFSAIAQEGYFTTYNFKVQSQNVSAVFDLFDDYYLKNKPAGVSVYLYENHFHDSGNDFTHSVVFTGTLDAVGKMYARGENDSWSLFITKINQLTEDVSSAMMGARIAGFGDNSQKYPFQRYTILDCQDRTAFTEAYNKINKDHNPVGRSTTMGSIGSGAGPDGGNTWVINGFKDFRAAIGGVNGLMTDAQRTARDKAWDEIMPNNGGVTVVRTGMRILLKEW